MKKTLIALAALAAGSAFAQSSVTIDGFVTLGLVKSTGTSAKLDAANGANQIRFRGTEDLGGGLKANFVLAQRFSPESGGNDGTANGRPTFQGESTVGLSGNFGSIKLGRALTALQGPIADVDPWGTWTVGSVHGLPTAYSTDKNQADGAGLGRTDGVFYTSPSMSGFTVSATVGLKNAAVANANNTKNLYSLWARYENGPILVEGGYEQNRQDDDITAIIGSYNFGPAKVALGYSQVDTVALAGSKGKNTVLSVIVPLAPVTLKAGYQNSKAENTGLKTQKYAVGAEYALSKRTYLYTTVARTKTDGASATTGFDLGISHAF